MKENGKTQFNDWQAGFINYLDSLNKSKTNNSTWVAKSNDNKLVSYLDRTYFKSLDDIREYCKHKGTTLEVLELIEKIFQTKEGQPLDDSELIKKSFPTTDENPSSNKLSFREDFLNYCGNTLWNLNDEVDFDLIFDFLLWLSKTKGEEKLGHGEKQIIYEEVLDYLTETRQNEKWSKLMLYWSKQYNQKIVKVLRSKDKYIQDHHDKIIKYLFLGDDKKNASYNTEDSIKYSINKLTSTDFQDIAFFFKKFNVLVNDYRYRNFQLKYIKPITSKMRNDFKSEMNEDIKSEMKKEINGYEKNIEDWYKNKGIVRNFFNWSKNHLEKFINVVLETENEHRWYFLSVALRLKYDRAKWLVSSKKDRNEACNLYKEIIDATEKFENENENKICVPKDAACRLYYMTATAYRYISQCAEYNIYPRNWNKKKPQELVIKAIEYAKKAFVEWKDECKSNSGLKIRESKKEYLKYVFSRHYAKIVTFAVRWMLTHNIEIDDLNEEEDLILDEEEREEIIDDSVPRLLNSAFLKYHIKVQERI